MQRPVRFVQVHEEVGSAAEHLDHVAEDRQALVAHHRLEVAARRWFGQRGLVELGAQQLALERPHAREVGEATG